MVRRAGGTPVYVYRRDALRAAVDRVRAASVPGAHIYYSLKANPHVGVVSCLSAVVDGFDVCSERELDTAVNVGMPPRRVLFTGPAKSRREMIAALAAGVAVTVESVGQARLFVEVAGELDVPGRAVLRLNTPYPGRAPAAATLPNQFGLADEDVTEAVDLLRDSISGVHLFWGSQYTDVGVIVAARRAALERAEKLADRFGLRFETVAIGGGIAMPWCDGDAAVNWAELAAASAALGLTGEGTVVCEYGRSIVGPAGSLITTVLDTKIVGDRRYVLVDAGMNHLMIASRLVAGGERGEPAVRVVAARNPSSVSPAYVTGPLCSQLDVLAADVPLPDVTAGDLLVFSGVGAYGPTFSPSGFLSRDPVREVVF